MFASPFWIKSIEPTEKKILWECDISRRDKNDDGMLTGDEVKKVNTPMMHRYMYELYMYTQNILWQVSHAKL